MTSVKKKQQKLEQRVELEVVTCNIKNPHSIAFRCKRYMHAHIVINICIIYISINKYYQELNI